jgi:chromosome segregation ATPase
MKYGWRNILFLILFGAVAFYVVSDYITSRSLSEEFKRELHRLDSISNQLESQQMSYDSLIITEQGKLEELEVKLGGIKDKTNQLNRMYKDLKDKADKYTPTQIDSFFRQRYKY